MAGNGFVRLASAQRAMWNARVTKAELRLRLAAQVHTWMLSGDEQRTASEAICGAIEQHRAWRDAKLVCAFLPLPSEPRVTPLWERDSGPDFCFPRVHGADLELIRIDDRERLASAHWKLAGAEFDAAPIVALDAVDLFLVPGLAFTHDGRRLGRGGGCYDRLLAHRASHSTALGVCFAIQLVDTLPVEVHDQRVDEVLTERGIKEKTKHETPKPIPPPHTQ
jgi:5-formyltetrahydrofolate cyclo-ligase